MKQGFGADLGAEKFIHIKCRKSGIRPACSVLVATIRAMKMHGDGNLQHGFENVQRHAQNMHKFGVSCLVAINRFADDTDEDINTVRELCERAGLQVAVGTNFKDGGAGAEELASKVVALCSAPAKELQFMYNLTDPYPTKIERVAQEIYHASGIEIAPVALKKMQQFCDQGYGELPICVAKTQYSFSDDPTRLNAPSDHILHVKDVRMSRGAGFLVVLTGSIMTMPGLVRQPAAERIKVDHRTGEIEGLI